MGKFAELCELLPADVNWGDNITPDIVEQIVLAEREACAKVCAEAAAPYQAAGASVALKCAEFIRMRSNAIIQGPRSGPAGMEC